MGISKKRKINQYKRILAAVIAVLGVCVLTICILATENISDMTQAAKITIIIGGCIAAYLLGMRSPTKRYLKCPKCGKYNYCKVIFNEE